MYPALRISQSRKVWTYEKADGIHCMCVMYYYMFGSGNKRMLHFHIKRNSLYLDGIYFKVLLIIS